MTGRWFADKGRDIGGAAIEDVLARDDAIRGSPKIIGHLRPGHPCCPADLGDLCLGRQVRSELSAEDRTGAEIRGGPRSC